MTADQEIELKFEVDGDDDAPERLRAALESRFGPGKPLHLASTYFDTADLSLREAALSLRVRQSQGRRVQTVKGPVAGKDHIFARGEWEREIGTDAPDLTSLTNTPLFPLLSRPELMQALGPAFESVIDRVTWTVSEGEDEFELALDQGVVTADGQSAPVRELEIELKSGRPEELLSLARELNEVASLRLGGRSKADRGYQLLEKTDRSAVAAQDVILNTEMTVGEGFQAIARNCIRHFMLNEPLLIRGRSDDALHQVRVALRRLRAALSLFRPALADGELDSLKRRTRDLARHLGAARNIDVFLKSLTPEEETGDQTALALAAQVRVEREAAYDDAIAAMTAPGARRLMFDLAVWIEAGPWTRTQATAHTPLPAFASDALERRRRKLKKSGAHMERLSTEERHRARIDVKKLRYAVEFFTSLYPAKKARREADAYLESLKGLQRDLGDLNDIAQAQDLTRTLAAGFAQRKGGPTSRGDLIYAAGREAGRRQADAPALLSTASEAYARFRQSKPFWD